MNPRRFTIIDNDTQMTKVIESTATTVAELKRDLRAAGFSVENKTIQEGLSRIEFKSDDAVLPHDVPRNGGVTNDLVFRLTKAQKHINSGAMDRKEAYAQVNALGLADAIAKKYGKNFTMCKTADLIAEVEKAQKKAAAPAPAPKVEKPAEAPAPENKEAGKPAPATTAPAAGKGGDCIVKQAVAQLTNILVNNGAITGADGQKIADILGVELSGPVGAVYSKSELANMFNGM